MSRFWRQALLLFLALRMGDLVNLAAGVGLVPRFISPRDLGAVLPVTTFATLFSLPLFAFAMTVMKEAADLAGTQAYGQLKSLWRGAFVATGLLTALLLTLAATPLARYLVRMRVNENADSFLGVSFLILGTTLLGSVAPVYTDALQAVKRFRALAAVELTAAVARFVMLLTLMPIRAFAGYFAGNAFQPFVRIAASLLALRRHFHARAEPFWTRPNAKRLFTRFAWILLYLTLPMFVSVLEQDLVRNELPSEASAAYYVITRLTDLMNYLTLPLLLVLFPYAAEARRNGRSTGPLVAKTSLVTLLAALALGLVYALWGEAILALIPNGAPYAGYLRFTPTLLAITALTACQTFYTNAEVAAGRFGFFAWFIPLHVAYGLTLRGLAHWCKPTFSLLLAVFLVGALLRGFCTLLPTAQKLFLRGSPRSKG